LFALASVSYLVWYLVVTHGQSSESSEPDESGDSQDWPWYVDVLLWAVDVLLCCCGLWAVGGVVMLFYILSTGSTLV